MSKTQAEYQKDYRARKKLTPETNALKTNAPETNAPEGPLIGWSRDTRRPNKDAVKDCLSCGGSGWSRSNRRCDCVCPVETDPETSGPAYGDIMGRRYNNGPLVAINRDPADQEVSA